LHEIHEVDEEPRERLEEMKVPPVEDGDLDGERAEAAGRVQAAEAPAHDHDARTGRVH
jgi:hypothetical protein